MKLTKSELKEMIREALREEFSRNLLENNNRFAKRVTYNGDADAIANRNRFPRQFNTTDQMMIDLRSQNGYRGYQLVNILEGNKVITCLIKLDKNNKILDRAPSNVDLDDVKAINDYINSKTSEGNLTEATPKVVNKPSDAVWVVAFKDDPEHPIIMGDKAKCDAFIKNNAATPATKSHGGLVIKQGGQVPVVDESLIEAVAKTASEIIRRYEDNVAGHIVELEHENAFYDAEWFEDEWYILEDVKVNPDHYILVMDRPVESTQDAEAIINYAFGFITNADEAFSEGGIVQDEGSNEIYIETWVVE